MTEREELETPEERVAWDLCQKLGVQPFECIPRPCERRFLGYEGDYYMNWARDRVDEVWTIIELVLDAAVARGEQAPKEESDAKR